MTSELIHGLSRVPQTATRPAAAAALAAQLEAGARFADPTADFTPGELREWIARIRGVADTLAGSVEAPLRNAILETLDGSSVPDEANALMVLRLNVCGESTASFAVECGLTNKTVDTIEKGGSCQIASAVAVADRFNLSNLDLFFSEIGGSKLRCRSVAGLRHALVTGNAPLDTDVPPE